MPEAEDAAVGSSNHGGDQDATSNKRKCDDDSHQNQQSNKRRKKNRNKRKNKGPNNKNNQNKGKNWIESCSESVDRVPANCAAPLTCVVTRVEIEEDPLLPKGLVGDSNEKRRDDDGKEHDKDKGEPAEVCGGGVRQEEKGESPRASSGHGLQATAASPCDLENTTDHSTVDEVAIPNIAGPSLAFISEYTKDKVPWKIPSTVKVADEEKKLFIGVQRHATATGPTKWAQRRKKSGKKQQSNNIHHHLPGGDNGDGVLNPYPSSAVPDKFWAQRKRLFSRHDEGIQIGGEDDPEMWYSVTPESIANHIAERTVSMIREQRSRCSQTTLEEEACPNGGRRSIVVLDVFCGCGGNSIAFARLNNHVENKRGDGADDQPPPQDATPRVKVIAVDNNLKRLKRCAHNAAIYGINKNDIVFIHADAVEVLSFFSNGVQRKDFVVNKKTCLPHNTSCASGFELGGIELLPDHVDGIFLSPPWGGMDYGNECGKAGFNPATSIMVQSTFEEARRKDDFDGPDKDSTGRTTTVATNGGELLSVAAKAVFGASKEEENGAIAYFLPRNTSGISMGQIAVASGISDGCFEMEQNVVNGKVKTVTAYFCPGLERMLK